MKWYDKQKKLFEEHQSTDEVNNKNQEVEDNFDQTDSLFMEAVINYTVDEENTIPHEDLVEAPFEEQKEIVILKTIINAGTKIQGSIEVDGDLEVSGDINGNITCKGDIRVDQGSISGNITANHMYIGNAIITGDITSIKTIEILQNAQITGNVDATSLSCNGYIKGDLRINGDLHLMHNAIIEGNIEARYMQSDKGSSIKGQCSIISAE